MSGIKNLTAGDLDEYKGVVYNTYLGVG